MSDNGFIDKIIGKNTAKGDKGDAVEAMTFGGGIWDFTKYLITANMTRQEAVGCCGNVRPDPEMELAYADHPSIKNMELA